MNDPIQQEIEAKGLHAPRVTSATGWFQSCSTCKQPRMMPSFDSMG